MSSVPPNPADTPPPSPFPFEPIIDPGSIQLRPPGPAFEPAPNIPYQSPAQDPSNPAAPLDDAPTQEEMRELEPEIEPLVSNQVPDGSVGVADAGGEGGGGG